MSFFPDCCTVIWSAPRLVPSAPRHDVGAPRLVDSTPWCSHACHRHCQVLPGFSSALPGPPTCTQCSLWCSEVFSKWSQSLPWHYCSSHQICQLLGRPAGMPSWSLILSWHLRIHVYIPHSYTHSWTLAVTKIHFADVVGWNVKATTSAKCKSVWKLHTILQDTPVALTSAFVYFQMLPGPPGALQCALRLCKSIRRCSCKDLQLWRCIQDATRLTIRIVKCCSCKDLYSSL